MDQRSTESQAFALPPAAGRVRDDRPALVRPDQALCSSEHWWGYDHEVVHVLCSHISSLATLRARETLYDRNEREAWEAAGVLPVLIKAFVQGRIIDRMAALQELLPWLM